MSIHYLTLDSAYRTFYSPELYILDDFLNKLDNNYYILLILFDLIAEFDYSILIKRLEDIDIVFL